MIEHAGDTEQKRTMASELAQFRSQLQGALHLSGARREARKSALLRDRRRAPQIDLNGAPIESRESRAGLLHEGGLPNARLASYREHRRHPRQIGRASCRGREGVPALAVAV